MMRRLVQAVLLLGIFQSGYCVQFDVKDESNKTCIMADLSINFTVDYKQSGKPDIAKFPLPGSAAVANTSSCGKNGTVPVLAIAFGSGNSLIMTFNKNDGGYYVDKLTFNYNLSDAVYFPGSTENGTRQAESSKSEISAKTSQFYKCSNPHFISMGTVNATFFNVKLEAYLNGGNYSKEATTCKEDVAPTTAPTTTPTAAPTVPPVNPTPETGDYRVNGSSGAACILARMGLHLNITYKRKDDKDAAYEFNIVPKNVTSTGTCLKDYATLQLSSEEVTLLFNFTLNATDSKFYLRFVHVNTIIPDAKEPKFNADGGNLSYLQTTTHKSYKCNSKQTLHITDNFSIDTYNLQVQAFDIDGNKFGPVVECAADQNGMLVPIIVGAALAGLVLIVLIAYLIGRKRSHAGYQTI